MELVLFLTGGSSLRAWEAVGSFDRELAAYRALHDKGVKVTIVSYGGPRELFFKFKLNGLGLIGNYFRLSFEKYAAHLKKNLPQRFKGETIFKSNQVWGADIALEIAKSAGKKFIARCGYLPSRMLIEGIDQDNGRLQELKDLESKVFNGADHVIVTTDLMRQVLIDEYGVRSAKITVLPNFVDTDQFQPNARTRKKHQLCYVGRLTQKKNLLNLFDALKGLDVILNVIGEGEQKEDLIKKVKAEGLSVSFLGRISHEQLPASLNQNAVFILPSLVEGHPKVLAEAMACGMPVIGTRVQGTREMINDHHNGLLCDTSAESMHETVKELISDPELCEKLGKQAREFALENYSLERIVEREYALIKKVANS